MYLTLVLLGQTAFFRFSLRKKGSGSQMQLALTPSTVVGGGNNKRDQSFDSKPHVLGSDLCFWLNNVSYYRLLVDSFRL